MNVFELITEIALEEMRVKRDAFRKWKERRKVPHCWRLAIMMAAKRRHIELHPSVFDDFADRDPPGPPPGNHDAAA